MLYVCNIRMLYVYSKNTTKILNKANDFYIHEC